MLELPKIRVNDTGIGVALVKVQMPISVSYSNQTQNNQPPILANAKPFKEFREGTKVRPIIKYSFSYNCWRKEGTEKFNETTGEVLDPQYIYEVRGSSVNRCDTRMGHSCLSEMYGSPLFVEVDQLQHPSNQITNFKVGDYVRPTQYAIEHKHSNLSRHGKYLITRIDPTRKWLILDARPEQTLDYSVSEENYELADDNRTYPSGHILDPCELRIGMKVRIRRFDKRPTGWNDKGLMDHWMGQVVTIKDLYGNIHIYEDYIDNVGSGWSWNKTDFETI